MVGHAASRIASFVRPSALECAVVYMKTATALGFTIPPSLLLRADEVIP